MVSGLVSVKDDAYTNHRCFQLKSEENDVAREVSVHREREGAVCKLGSLDSQSLLLEPRPHPRGLGGSGGSS